MQNFLNRDEHPLHMLLSLIRERSLVRVQAGPLIIHYILQVKHSDKEEAPERIRGFGAATVQQRSLSGERGFHRPHGLISHTRQKVRVGVQGHRYRGVPEKLLDELGMGALREQ